MRIGSRVSYGFMDNEGQWSIAEGAAVGTIVGITNGADRDGFDTIESVTIRWDNGKVEADRQLEGEHEESGTSWELVDVTPLLYVNLYLQDREYGGPEEGGWWYDTYSPVTKDYGDWNTEPPTFGHFLTAEAAEKATEAINAWCEFENRTRRSPSSVASDGHYCVRLESWPAEPMPARKPHYC
jgi:hypothetical protein